MTNPFTASTGNLFIKSTARTLLTLVYIMFVTILTAQVEGVDIPFPISHASASIHTVQLHPVGIPTAHPMIALNGGQLNLSFDDFDPEYRSLEYRVQHCTFDWYASPDLEASDYIAGFPTQSFATIESSFNTKTPYTHFATTFPNEMMQFSKSGNYVLEVYNPSNPDRILVQIRFVVYESLIDIEMAVKPSSVIRNQRTHQEVDLALMHSQDRYPIVDAYDALQTVLLQNGRWETAQLGLEPQFVMGEEITYNPTGDQCFKGGNTWRFTDLKSLRFASMGLERIVDEGRHWHAYLEVDEPRPFAFLKVQQDLDGHFVIANELQDDATGSDYIWAHFRLKTFEERLREDVYIYGEISNWSYPESHRMIWNAESRCYEAELFLKQGYYNYEYRVRPSNDRGRNDAATLLTAPSDVEPIEGSHALADTPYQCIVYYWDFEGYDRVIGLAQSKPGSSY